MTGVPVSVAAGGSGRLAALRGAIADHGGWIGALVAVFALFGALEPDLFLAEENLWSVARQASVTGMVVLGITVPLSVHDFDLSIVGVMGFAGGMVVVLTNEGTVAWPVAVLLAVLAAAAVGLVNGIFVGTFGLSAFIVTLATGSLAIAGEIAVTDHELVGGVSQGLIDIVDAEVGAVPLTVFFYVGAVALVVAVERSEFGRRIRAIGGNPTAAHLAGVRVARIRATGLVISAVAAGLTGIFIVSRAGAYTPDLGRPFLIPTYAAAFVGASLGPGRRFSAFGATFGIVLLALVRNGLLIVGLRSWVINIVEGAILVGAIVLAGLTSGGRRA